MNPPPEPFLPISFLIYTLLNVTGRQTSFWNTFSAQEDEIDIEAAAGVGPSEPGYGTGGQFSPPQPFQTPNLWGGRPL